MRALWAMMKFLLCLAVFALSSCSLMFEAATITRNRAREVPQGSVVAGQGFTVSSPEPGLYPLQDYPQKGGVSFRPVATELEGLVYFVTPYQSVSARTTEEALYERNARVQAPGRPFKVSEKSATSFAGLKGTRAIAEVAMSADGGLISETLVLKRGGEFLVLTRGDVYYRQEDRERAKNRCKTGLRNLMQRTTLTAP